MIIIKITGGLGNQMFQYALGRALSLKKGVPFKLDISSYRRYKLHNKYELSDVFNISPEIASTKDLVQFSSFYNYIRKYSRLPRTQIIEEPCFQYWNGINYLQNKVYLNGYWQSPKYFSDYSDVIKSDFVFRNILDKDNQKLFEHISKSNSVSMHIRRGDYTSAKNINVHGTCKLSYYEDAVRYFQKKLINPIFFVFSDDIEWAKANLKNINNVKFVSNNSGKYSYIDMMLMSLCKHNIIANSSFSWWSAWLNSNPHKNVIAPVDWFSKSYSKSKNILTTDLIPEDWILISNN